MGVCERGAKEMGVQLLWLSNDEKNHKFILTLLTITVEIITNKDAEETSGFFAKKFGGHCKKCHREESRTIYNIVLKRKTGQIIAKAN